MATKPLSAAAAKQAVSRAWSAVCAPGDDVIGRGDAVLALQLLGHNPGKVRELNSMLGLFFFMLFKSNDVNYKVFPMFSVYQRIVYFR